MNVTPEQVAMPHATIHRIRSMIGGMWHQELKITKDWATWDEDVKEAKDKRYAINTFIHGQTFELLVALDNWLNGLDRTPADYVLMDSKGFINVEYDLTYTGGDYNRTGSFVHVPVYMIELHGGDTPKAFKEVTGIDPIHIVHYSPDEVVGEKGQPFEG
jgi:hypothetical protein